MSLQDLVIPALRPPVMYQSPLLGNKPGKRTRLASFRGALREHEPRYSRGIRQRLHQLATTQDWASQFNIWIGNREEAPEDYSTLLSTSTFCLVLPGTSQVEAKPDIASWTQHSTILSVQKKTSVLDVGIIYYCLLSGDLLTMLGAFFGSVTPYRKLQKTACLATLSQMS